MIPEDSDDRLDPHARRRGDYTERITGGVEAANLPLPEFPYMPSTGSQFAEIGGGVTRHSQVHTTNNGARGVNMLYTSPTMDYEHAPKQRFAWLQIFGALGVLIAASMGISITAVLIVLIGAGAVLIGDHMNRGSKVELDRENLW